MATARPGWSRKAQYSLFFSFIAAIAGLLIGLVLLAVSFVAPRSYAAVRGAALDATAPVTSGLREVTDTVNGLFSGAGNYWDAAHQNAQLKRERELMIQRIIEAKAISQENRELKAARHLPEPIYGITTGVGKLKDVVIPPAERTALQRNLVLSHAAGVAARNGRFIV